MAPAALADNRITKATADRQDELTINSAKLVSVLSTACRQWHADRAQIRFAIVLPLYNDDNAIIGSSGNQRLSIYSGLLFLQTSSSKKTENFHADH